MRVLLILLLALGFYLDAELVLLRCHVVFVVAVTGACLWLVRAIVRKTP